MPLFSTTLSSANTIPGNTTPCALNWIGGKNITIAVYTSANTGSADFTIQYTLDDIMRTASSLVQWAALSSNPWNQVDTTPTAGFHYTSSAIPVPDGFLMAIPTPMAAIRINSTALSSVTLTFKVLQGEGG